MLHPAIIVRSTPNGTGKGLYATSQIAQGTLVWQLDEVTFSKEEIGELTRSQRADFEIYGFQCGFDRFSNPLKDCRYMNHSCDPNLWWRGSESLIARREIYAGEEVCYDYSSADIELAFEISCLCGAKICRKRVTHLDYLQEGFQALHEKNLPKHVLKAVEASLKCNRSK